MIGDIEIRGLSEIERMVRKSGTVAMQAANRGLAKCGSIAVRAAFRNAPKSPTKKQYSATLKRKKRTDRKNFYPGGLETSIESETKDGVCMVFVSENSKAGKYARRIHDEKGKTWKHRGPGTIVKGRQADEKFIERAIRDNEDVFNRTISTAIKKALGKL